MKLYRNFTSQEEIDLEYNLALTVPDIEHWIEQSTQYLQAWRANGLWGELLVQEGKHHFSAVEGLVDANSTLCNGLIGFLAQCEGM